MGPWSEAALDEAVARVERDLESLVAISSPSGDVDGAERCVALVASRLPAAAAVERLPCSTDGCADDLLATLTGTGAGRLLLLGHLDTVISHADHRCLSRSGDRLVGPGTIDMKGGDAMAIALFSALAGQPGEFAEVALLLVCDEEWRSAPFAHAERFAGWDACLCFEAGELTDAGEEAVIVRRKAAATLRVAGRGRAAHSGAEPERGRNALLALAQVAQLVDQPPGRADHLTVVPTLLHSGEAFNVVPAYGELHCDLRCTRTEAFDEVRRAVPQEIAGVSLEADLIRVWPAMDTANAGAALLADAGRMLGRRIVAAGRGGASDASHLASVVPVTIDGLGPRGGGAHHAVDEHVLLDSLRPRTEVAFALAAAALAGRQA